MSIAWTHALIQNTARAAYFGTFERLALSTESTMCRPLVQVVAAETIDFSILICIMSDVLGELGEPVRHTGHFSWRMLLGGLRGRSGCWQGRGASARKNKTCRASI